VSRACSLLGAALLLLTGARGALPAPADAHPTGRQVDLIVGATANDTQLFEPSIRDLLAAKGLKVSTTRKAAVTAQDVAAAIAPPKESAPPVARLLLDFTVPGQGTLFLIDPRRGRVYVRRLALPRGLDAVARASARFVIEQSIDAILEGRDIGVSREEFQRSMAPPPSAAPTPSPPAVPPVIPPPAPVERRLLLAGGYDGLALGAGQYQHAAKVVLAMRFTRFQIAGAARLAAPLSIAGDGVQARLSTGGINVSGTGRLFTVQELSIIAGLGVGADLTRVAPAVSAPDLQPAGAFWAKSASLQGFAAIEGVFGRILVMAAAGVEAHLLAERYTVRADGATREVFVPRRLRPAAALLAGVLF
jgi:hypothetical protein